MQKKEGAKPRTDSISTQCSMGTSYLGSKIRTYSNTDLRTKKKIKIVKFYYITKLLQNNIFGELHSSIYKNEELNIKMPLVLKKILVNDWHEINYNKCTMSLPRIPNVEFILNDTQKHLLSKKEVNPIYLKDVINKLKDYFNNSLFTFLLYNMEEKDEFMKLSLEKQRTPIAIYGIEHFLRLIVFLPKLLCGAGMDKIALDIMTKIMSKILWQVFYAATPFSKIAEQRPKYMEQNHQNY